MTIAWFTRTAGAGSSRALAISSARRVRAFAKEERSTFRSVSLASNS